MCMFITDSSRYVITPHTTESRNTCLSVDGQLHEDGDSWHDGCRLCYCYGGQEMCALISCPRPSCSTPVFRLGDCCPSCPGEHHLFSKVNQYKHFFLGQLSFIVILESYIKCEQRIMDLWKKMCQILVIMNHILCDSHIIPDLYDHSIEIIEDPT